MAELLTSPWFLYGAFPLGSTALGVAVKYTSRNDRYAKFRKEDMAVGLELIMTACLMFVLLTTDRAVKLLETGEALAGALQRNPIPRETVLSLQEQTSLLSGQLAASGWLVAVMFLGLWSVSTIVRKWGWEGDEDMRPLVGIALPLAVGVIAITAVMVEAAR